MSDIAATRWEQRNPERAKEIRRKYRLRNKDKIREQERAYRKLNPEKFRAANKRWRLANPDYSRKWKANNPEKVRTSRLKERFGITPESYADLLGSQEGKCAICGCEQGGRSFDIDHCHVTGKIRGLLCTKCNRGIGYLGDDAARLVKAINYLSQ